MTWHFRLPGTEHSFTRMLTRLCLSERAATDPELQKTVAQTPWRTSTSLSCSGSNCKCNFPHLLVCNNGLERYRQMQGVHFIILYVLAAVTCYTLRDQPSSTCSLKHVVHLTVSDRESKGTSIVPLGTTLRTACIHMCACCE